MPSSHSERPFPRPLIFSFVVLVGMVTGYVFVSPLVLKFVGERRVPAGSAKVAIQVKYDLKGLPRTTPWKSADSSVGANSERVSEGVAYDTRTSQAPIATSAPNQRAETGRVISRGAVVQRPPLPNSASSAAPVPNRPINESTASSPGGTIQSPSVGDSTKAPAAELAQQNVGDLSASVFLTPVLRVTDSGLIGVVVAPRKILKNQTSNAPLKQSVHYKIAVIAPRGSIDISPEEATPEERELEGGGSGLVWNWAIQPRQIGSHDVQITGLPTSILKDGPRLIIVPSDVGKFGRDMTLISKVAEELPSNSPTRLGNGAVVIRLQVLDEYGLAPQWHAAVTMFSCVASGLGTAIVVGIATGIFTVLGGRWVTSRGTEQAKPSRNASSGPLIAHPSEAEIKKLSEERRRSAQSVVQR